LTHNINNEIVVKVLFFGAARDAVGQGEVDFILNGASTAANAFERVLEKYPDLRRFGRSLLFAVNQEYAGPKAKLSQGDEIALLPPVSGGSETSEVPAKGKGGEPKGRPKHAAIVRERIETRAVLEGIKRAEDGAAVARALAGYPTRNNDRGAAGG